MKPSRIVVSPTCAYLMMDSNIDNLLAGWLSAGRIPGARETLPPLRINLNCRRRDAVVRAARVNLVNEAPSPPPQACEQLITAVAD
ncbi:hypothetical protein [Rhodococcus qingshengii]